MLLKKNICFYNTKPARSVDTPFPAIKKEVASIDGRNLLHTSLFISMSIA